MTTLVLVEAKATSKMICCCCEELKFDSSAEAAVQELLRLEKERNALLEATIKSLTFKVKEFEAILFNFDLKNLQKEKKQKAVLAVQQALYKRTCSIESDQVAEDIDEAVDPKGRQAANKLEHEQKQKRTWRRTGIKQLSSDYRDAL